MSCQTPTVSDITLLNQFFSRTSFNDANASICNIGWVKMSECFMQKKVSVSRMILKCNSEDVKKARIGKSSFLISVVSKNLVMSVFFCCCFFFLSTFPGTLTAVELSLICAKVQLYNSTFSTLQSDPRNFQRDASTENDHLKTFTLRE